MIHTADPDWNSYAGVVQDNIGDFVDELRSIDLVDLTSFIRMECFPNIEDLVNSSTELFFRTEMLVFSWAACVDLQWDKVPSVTLGMEFRHPSVSLFFNLLLGAARESVEVLGVVFEEPRIDHIEQLRIAFADARLADGSITRITGARHASRGAVKRSRWP